MTTYAFAVKVRRFRSCWLASCSACPWSFGCIRRDLALREAHTHAANCESLHRLNWRACVDAGLAPCPSCWQYGKVARACHVCLGRGYEAEREWLE